MSDEENLSTEPPGSQASPRLSRPHGDQERTPGPRTSPGQGAQAPVGVSAPGRSVERLKKRRDFLAVAKGRKAARRPFVLERRQRGDDDAARFGFTVTKRTARKAVERNRIRRRLREAVRLAAADATLTGADYVLVGRRGALTESFASIRAELRGALAEAASVRPTGAAARSDSR